MSALDFSPKTKTVPASFLRVGTVVMESHEHPARITRIKGSTTTGRFAVYARFIWQRDTERDWLLGQFRIDDPIEKAI